MKTITLNNFKNKSSIILDGIILKYDNQNLNYFKPVPNNLKKVKVVQDSNYLLSYNSTANWSIIHADDKLERNFFGSYDISQYDIIMDFVPFKQYTIDKKLVINGSHLYAGFSNILAAMKTGSTKTKKSTNYYLHAYQIDKLEGIYFYLPKHKVFGYMSSNNSVTSDRLTARFPQKIARLILEAGVGSQDYKGTIIPLLYNGLEIKNSRILLLEANFTALSMLLPDLEIHNNRLFVTSLSHLTTDGIGEICALNKPELTFTSHGCLYKFRPSVKVHTVINYATIKDPKLRSLLFFMYAQSYMHVIDRLIKKEDRNSFFNTFTMKDVE